MSACHRRGRVRDGGRRGDPLRLSPCWQAVPAGRPVLLRSLPGTEGEGDLPGAPCGNLYGRQGYLHHRYIRRLRRRRLRLLPDHGGRQLLRHGGAVRGLYHGPRLRSRYRARVRVCRCEPRHLHRLRLHHSLRAALRGVSAGHSRRESGQRLTLAATLAVADWAGGGMPRLVPAQYYARRGGWPALLRTPGVTLARPFGVIGT